MTTTAGQIKFDTMTHESVDNIGLTPDTLKSVRDRGLMNVEQLAQALKGGDFSIDEFLEIEQALDELEMARFSVGA